MDFDAVLLLSFGGPEGPEQVRPFLENVTRGRGVPPERLDDVAEHYLHFGGVSPINGVNRALVDEIRAELAARGRDLPVYFGNRNWQPYSKTRSRPCATTAFGGQPCSRRRRGAAIPAARSTWRTSCVPAGGGRFCPGTGQAAPLLRPPLLVELFADAIGPPRRRCHGTSATRRGLCLPPTPFRSAPSRCGIELYAVRSRMRPGWWPPRPRYRDYDQVWQSRSGPPQVPWLEPDVPTI